MWPWSVPIGACGCAPQCQATVVFSPVLTIQPLLMQQVQAGMCFTYFNARLAFDPLEVFAVLTSQPLPMQQVHKSMCLTCFNVGLAFDPVEVFAVLTSQQVHVRTCLLQCRACV